MRPRLARELLGPDTGSPGAPASAMRTIGILRGFRLATLQLCLTEFGGLGRVGSCLQSGFFQEVAPTLMPVGRALFGFEVLQGRFRVLPSLDDLNHPCGLVSTNVVPDYNVRRLQLVVCQMVSLVPPQPATVRVSAQAVISKLIGVPTRTRRISPRNNKLEKDERMLPQLALSLGPHQFENHSGVGRNTGQRHPESITTRIQDQLRWKGAIFPASEIMQNGLLPCARGWR
jgi:hypothetical protein